MKNKHVLFLLIGQYFILNIYGQQLNFSKVYYGWGDAYANSVIQTPDGNYVLAGIHDGKAFASKMDSVCNIIWNMEMGISGNERFNCLAGTHDSSYVFAGYGWLGSLSSVKGILLVKLNYNGDTLWSKMLDSGGEALSIHETFDHGFIVGGSPSFVLKLDSLGNLEWGKEFASGNYENWNLETKQTSDSGYIMIGHTSDTSGSLSANAFVLKLSASGNVIWSKKYNDQNTGFSVGKDLEITDDGYVCLLTIYGNVVIMKIDSAGDVLWSKSFNHFAGYDCSNCTNPRLVPSADNSFLISSSSNGFCCNNYAFKVDTAGNMLQAISLQLDVKDILFTMDERYLIIGNGPVGGLKTSSPSIPQYGIIYTDSLCSGIWCASPFSDSTQIDSIAGDTVSVNVTNVVANLIYPNLPLYNPTLVVDLDCVPIIGKVYELNSTDDFVVYPNPASNEINILVNDSHEKIILSVLSSDGKIIYYKTILENENSFTLPVNLSGGIYVILCQTIHKSFSKKLVVY